MFNVRNLIVTWGILLGAGLALPDLISERVDELNKNGTSTRRKMVMIEPEDVGLVHTAALEHFQRRIDEEIPLSKQDLRNAIVHAIYMSLCDEGDQKCNDAINATATTHIDDLGVNLLMGPEEGLQHVVKNLPPNYDNASREAIETMFDGFSLLNSSNHESLIQILNGEIEKLKSNDNVTSDYHRHISIIGLSVGVESTKQWIETINQRPRSLISKSVRACEARSFTKGTTFYGPVFPWEMTANEKEARGTGGNHVNIYHPPDRPNNNFAGQNNAPPIYNNPQNNPNYGSYNGPYINNHPNNAGYNNRPNNGKYDNYQQGGSSYNRPPNGNYNNKPNRGNSNEHPYAYNRPENYGNYNNNQYYGTYNNYGGSGSYNGRPGNHNPPNYGNNRPSNNAVYNGPHGNYNNNQYYGNYMGYNGNYNNNNSPNAQYNNYPPNGNNYNNNQGNYNNNPPNGNNYNNQGNYNNNPPNGNNYNNQGNYNNSPPNGNYYNNQNNGYHDNVADANYNYNDLPICESSTIKNSNNVNNAGQAGNSNVYPSNAVSTNFGVINNYYNGPSTSNKEQEGAYNSQNINNYNQQPNNNYNQPPNNNYNHPPNNNYNQPPNNNYNYPPNNNYNQPPNNNYNQPSQGYNNPQSHQNMYRNKSNDMNNDANGHYRREIRVNQDQGYNQYNNNQRRRRHDDDDDYYYDYKGHKKSSKLWYDDDDWHDKSKGNTNYFGPVTYGTSYGVWTLPPTPSPRYQNSHSYNNGYPQNDYGYQNSNVYQNNQGFNNNYGYPCIEIKAPTPSPIIEQGTLAPTTCLVEAPTAENDPLFEKIVAVILGDVIGAVVGGSGALSDAFFNATTFGDSFGLDDLAVGALFVTSAIRSIAGSILAFVAAFLHSILL